MTATPVLAHTREELAGLLAAPAGPASRVAFVPTMGALHEGHASLMRTAREATPARSWSASSSTRCSSAPTEDLDRYPRTLDADLEVCAAEGVDVVFAPSVEEMYPGGFSHDSVRDGVTVAPGALGRRSSTASPGPGTSTGCSPWSPSSSAWSAPTSRSSARRTTSSSP